MQKMKQFKLLKVLFLLVVLMFVAVVSTGCDKPGTDPVTYTVTFKVDGAVTSTQTVESASDLVVPTNPTKAGFVFQHWALEGKTTKYITTTAITANIVLVAVFEEDVDVLEDFTVTFVVDGVEPNVQVEVQDGGLAVRPAIDPTKDGYNFVGWFVGDVEYVFSTPVTADVTITALFELIAVEPFVVGFNVDGSVTDTSVNAGDAAVAIDTPTKDGFVFVEWQLDGVAYNFATPVTANIVLTALFAEAVTVTFNFGGSPIVETIAINTAVDQPANPTKAGFIFVEWQLGTVAYDFATLVVANIILDAKFDEAASYSITYELNGGTQNEANPATHLNDTALVLAAPTKAGNLFVAWYGNVELTGEAITEIAALNTEDVTVYAKWDDSANATYTLNGGSLTVADIIEFRETTHINTARYITIDWSGKSIIVGTAVAGGFWNGLGFKATATPGIYELVGKGVGYANAEATLFISYHDDINTIYKDDMIAMYTNAVVGSLIVVKGLPTSATTTANIDIYFMDADAATADVTAKLQPSDDMLMPVRAGYAFLGWCEESDLSDTPVTVYPGNAGGTDITYYAKWAVAKTVTYVLNGGTNAVANPSIFAEENLPIVLASATKVGYTFDGWFTEDTFATEVTEITEFADITLYAKFSLIDYTITYALDGSTNPVANPSNYNIETATITLTAAEKDDYRFLGWFTTATFDEGTAVTTIALGSFGDKNFYASFELITAFNITYELNSGTNGANPDTFVSEDLPLTLVPATKANYDFVGWFTTATFDEGTDVTAITAEADISLFAKFTATEFAITYDLDEGENALTNPEKYTVETATITLVDAEKTGYMFEGWFSEAAFETEVTEIALGSTGAVALFAKFVEIVTYDITYDLDGGTNGANPDTYTNYTATISLADATKAGFVFKGWFSEATFTTEVTEIALGSNGDVTLFALFADALTVTFDVDGDLTLQYVESGNLAVAPADPTDEFYNFVEWQLDGVVYDFSTPVTADITLTAVFVLATEFNITYANMTNAKWSKDVMLTEFLTDLHTYVNAPESLSDFIHGVGLTTGFKGLWQSNSDYKTKIYAVGRPAAANASLALFICQPAYYDKWMPFMDFLDALITEQNSTQNLWGSTYTGYLRIVAYFTGTTFTEGRLDKMPASYVPGVTVYTSETGEIILPTPIKTGSTFLGWYSDAEFTGSAITSITAGSTGHKTFYAKWEVA